MVHKKKTFSKIGGHQESPRERLRNIGRLKLPTVFLHWGMSKLRDSNLCVHQVSVTNTGKSSSQRTRPPLRREGGLCKGTVESSKAWQAAEMVR